MSGQNVRSKFPLSLFCLFGSCMVPSLSLSVHHCNCIFIHVGVFKATLPCSALSSSAFLLTSLSSTLLISSSSSHLMVGVGIPSSPHHLLCMSCRCGRRCSGFLCHLVSGCVGLDGFPGRSCCDRGCHSSCLRGCDGHRCHGITEFYLSVGCRTLCMALRTWGRCNASQRNPSEQQFSVLTFCESTSSALRETTDLPPSALSKSARPH